MSGRENYDPCLTATPEEWRRRAIEEMKARHPRMARMCWHASEIAKWREELEAKRNNGK